MTPRAFIISLARETERQEKSISECETAGLDYEIVDAIDARDYKTANGKPLWEMMKRDGYDFDNSRWGVQFTPSEVAIYHSHLLVYRKIIAERLPWAFVFEDDMALSAAPYGMLEVADEVDSMPPGNLLHVTLHAEYPEWNHAKVVKRHSDRLNVVRPCPVVAVAYIATRKFASYVLRNHAKMDAPIDHLIARISRNPNVLFLMTNQPIACQTGAQSTQE